MSAPLEVTDGGEWVGPVTWAPGEGGAWSFQSQFSPRQPSRWAEQATMWMLSRVMCCVDALDPSSWEAFWVRAAAPHYLSISDLESVSEAQSLQNKTKRSPLPGGAN